jgi:hypothetical protein
MPSNVPRSQHPYSQQQSLEKREQKLRRAIAAMAPVEKLQQAAEGVRASQLLLLKAEFELIRYSDAVNDRRIRNIELKRDYWQTISVEAILVQYSNR